jgi:hypothetical protein
VHIKVSRIVTGQQGVERRKYQLIHLNKDEKGKIEQKGQFNK